jgi:hypothetical protein
MREGRVQVLEVTATIVGGRMCVRKMWDRRVVVVLSRWAKRLVLVVWQESRMTSVRFTGDGMLLGRVSMEREGEPTSSRSEVLVWEGGRPSSELVLDVVDRTIRTIVFVLHEETVNQFPGMAFTGVFLQKGGEHLWNGTWSGGTISGSSNTRFGRVVEDNGVFSLFYKPCGVVLYPAVFWIWRLRKQLWKEHEIKMWGCLWMIVNNG